MGNMCTFLEIYFFPPIKNKNIYIYVKMGISTFNKYFKHFIKLKYIFVIRYKPISRPIHNHVVMFWMWTISLDQNPDHVISTYQLSEFLRCLPWILLMFVMEELFLAGPLEKNKRCLPPAAKYRAPKLVINPIQQYRENRSTWLQWMSLQICQVRSRTCVHLWAMLVSHPCLVPRYPPAMIQYGQKFMNYYGLGKCGSVAMYCYIMCKFHDHAAV